MERIGADRVNEETGEIINGMNDLKAHPFFKGIDFS
jgi:hypothetical protein